jgi:hypothetical protein
MSPSNWGPPIWTFFHTLAEKINEETFQSVFPILFNYIRRICTVLPCPECSQHATRFLAKVNPAGVRDKNDFRNIMCIFHNAVNRRKNKPLFDSNNLTATYGFNNVIATYNNFAASFHTKGNMNLLAETFQRQLLMSEFRKWFLTNIRFFIPKQIPSQ